MRHRPPTTLMSPHALVARSALGIVATLTCLLVIAAGVAVTFTDPRSFPTVVDGLWWSASTVTTVGYGDFVPRSTPGRLVGAMLMFTGIGLVSILTAAIASALLAEEVGDEEHHIDEELEAIRGHLEALRQELQSQRDDDPTDAR